MKRKWLFAGIAVSVLIVSLLVGQLMLYWNLIIGNDTLITLSTDKEYVLLKHGMNQTLNVEASILSNMFCNSHCIAAFSDLNRNETIDRAEFNLKTAQPFKKQYPLYPGIKGEGFKVYRFSMECISEKSFLCHTGERPTTRSALVIVEYRLDEEEEIERNKVVLAESIAKRHAELSALARQSSATIAGFKSLRDDDLLEISRQLEAKAWNISEKLAQTVRHWENEEYIEFGKPLALLEEECDESIAKAESQINSLTILVQRHDNALKSMRQSRDTLSKLQQMTMTNRTLVGRITRASESFNSDAALFRQRGMISTKEQIAENMRLRISELNKSIDSAVRREYLMRHLKIDALYKALFEVVGEKPSEYANNTEKSISESCLHAEALAAFAEKYINGSINSTIDSRAAIRTLLSKIYDRYTPGSADEKEVLNQLKADYDENATLLPGQEATYVKAIIEEIPRCKIIPVAYPELDRLEGMEERLSAREPEKVLFRFSNPTMKCGLFAREEECCKDCWDRNYPVLLFHGHAFDKGVSYEYSLEGWTAIQARLEEDGVLNGGTINVYGPDRMPSGVIGNLNMPVSFRASYYFDVLTEPGSFAVVQSKSENIDTYAIRVKEVIARVKAKTGKNKVRIVAFSMGGLVARRYIQIFGDNDVASLVLLGVPNKGISGKVSQLCDVRGSPVECRDMDEDSLFIRKLNSAKLPDIPITNIVAGGCNMDGEDGDGIVLLRNAKLDGITNIFINGTCRGTTTPLHIDLLDIEMYPQVYGAIRESLI